MQLRTGAQFPTWSAPEVRLACTSVGLGAEAKLAG